MNKQNMKGLGNMLNVGDPVTVLWRYDDVTDTIFWIGNGTYSGKQVPDQKAAGFMSKLFRDASCPCDAVILPTQNMVFDTECTLYPLDFWQHSRAKAANVVQVDLAKVRESLDKRLTSWINQQNKMR